MADRRMFSKKIIDTDLFLDMPASTRLLYYDLSMRADDDGFVSSPKKITRTIGCSDDDFKLLIAKQFIIPFESGICVIKDWKIHNYIQNDRYHPTTYLSEKTQLAVEQNGTYTRCIQDVSKMDTQVRLELGKDRLGEDRLGKDTIMCPYQQIMQLFNSTCKSLPKIKDMTDKRQKAIKTWWDKESLTLEDLRRFFEKVENSRFLTGQVNEFRACFDWIVKPSNRQKIVEGNYDSSGSKPNKQKSMHELLMERLSEEDGQETNNNTIDVTEYSVSEV